MFTFVKTLCFFFFQAEDGIRDAQESRGLGDVYKRQEFPVLESIGLLKVDFLGLSTLSVMREATRLIAEPVSYTHLTLPTIYSV